jgi:hypothetical protein
VYKLGEPVEVGHLHYTVSEAKWLTQLPGSLSPRLPQQRFCLLNVSVMNGGGENLMLPNLTIEDESGETFQELSDGTGVPEWAGYLRKAVPAEVTRGNIVFDAPPKVYRLRVVDESGENPALIEIPLAISPDKGAS